MALTTQLVTLPNGVISVCWRRSPRARRVSLRIDPRQGGVVVTLPPRGTQAAGLALLHSHAAWVAARLRKLPESVTLADGVELPLAGVAHRVRHMQATQRGAWIEDGEIRVSGDVAFLPRRVIDLLRTEARRRLSALAREKALLAALSPARIICKDTSSRWGSCTASGVLMFSWRLVMAPDFVQDYVAAHEVAHLRHMNHGAHFWALVRELTPHTDAATQWLKTHGPGLLNAFSAP